MPKAKDEGLLPTIYGDDGGTRMTYSLLVQKQSGARPFSFTSRVDLPRGYHVTWSSHERTAGERGGSAATSVAGAINATMTHRKERARSMVISPQVREIRRSPTCRIYR